MTQPRPYKSVTRLGVAELIVSGPVLALTFIIALAAFAEALT